MEEIEKKESEAIQIKQPEIPLIGVLGDSGTKGYGGYFMEEPNAEWRDMARIDNVETMRRTDGTVKQLLLAIKSPITAVEPIIEAGSEDPQHQKHKEFIEDNLRFWGQRRSWSDFAREALAYLDFGFSVWEKIYVKRDGFIYLKDLAPRIQSSVMKWEIDGLDVLGRPRKGVTQQLMTDNHPTSQTQIPMEKLLILTNDKEGDDLTGQSVLRAAWKHFYIKDNLYKISAISSERYGVGIPVVTTPETAGPEEKQKAEELGRNLKSNEKSYLVLPNGWTVTILTPNGNPQQGAIDNLISHHDRMILCAGLAAFLNLGSQGGGSYALSADQSPFFVKNVEGIAKYLAEQFTRQVIMPLIVLNFGEQETYPKMTYPSLAQSDFSTFATAIKTLIDAGLVKVDGRLMQFVHKKGQLPVITQDQVDEMDLDAMEDDMNSLDLPAEEEPTEVDVVDDFPEDEDIEEEEPVIEDEEI